MTPLRQRFIEDMQLRGLAPTTQRSYIHYVSEYAKFYNTSPDKLDLEAIRQCVFSAKLRSADLRVKKYLRWQIFGVITDLLRV